METSKHRKETGSITSIPISGQLVLSLFWEVELKTEKAVVQRIQAAIKYVGA